MRSSWLVSGCLLLTYTACGPTEHVGSRDCKVLAEVANRPWFLEACNKCQGQPCDAEGCDIGFPCHEGKLLAIGCEQDSDCAPFEHSICGMYMAPNQICTTQGDDI